MDQEKRKRIVRDALGNFKHVKAAKAAERDGMQQLIVKTNAILNGVYDSILPVLKAGGGFPKDRDALKQMIMRNALDGICILSKDELQVLVAIGISEDVLDRVDKNPWGGAPDLLST